jgi:hypothetical protein
MSVSKAQAERVEVVCSCGCGETFMAFPVYRKKSEGGGLRVPEYKRGHHPNCRKSQNGNAPAWNKGLTKQDHPSIKRMGFQKGHPPHNDWSRVNELLASDADVRRRWLRAKQGQTPWNQGLTKDRYPNGIATGADHGNWKGGHGGMRDTSEWASLRKAVQRRDHYTCQMCGDRNHKGRGSKVVLHVHHIVAVCEDPTQALNPDNLITLCAPCHYETHNYGAKAVSRKRLLNEPNSRTP